MQNSVLISFNNAGHSHREAAYVQELVNDLHSHHVNVQTESPATLVAGMKSQIFAGQWLVLFLTPDAIRSAQVKSLVNTALDCVKQGQMRGVVALAFLSDPVESDDMPDPLWYTIRTYYVSENPEEQRLIFNKIARLSGSVTPVRTASPAVSDWTSSLPASNHLASLNQTNSRSLPAASSKPAQKAYFRLMAPLLVFTLVIGMILGAFASSFIQDHFPHPTITAASTPTTTSTKNHPGTNQQVHPPTPAPSHNKQTQTTPTTDPTTKLKDALANLNNDPKTFYKLLTQNQTLATPINFSMTKQDGQGYTPNGCAFNNGQYQISVSVVTNPAIICLADNTNYTDFAYQVKMIVNNNDAGGLIFLSNGDQNYSRLSLDSSGHYTLYECLTNCSNPAIDNGKKVGDGNLLNGGQSISGQPELLTIIVHNNVAYFYVNGKFVKQWSESDGIFFGTGSVIGLFAASNASSSTQVTFSEGKVWDLTKLT